MFRNGSNPNVYADKTSIVVGRRELLHIKGKALRRGLWFKVLSRIERTMVSLAIKVLRGPIKSSGLAKVMMDIVAKLRDAMENQIFRLAREVGRPLACRLSRVAVAWGNKSAFLWVRDTYFIRYLTITHMNLPQAFS